MKTISSFVVVIASALLLWSGSATAQQVPTTAVVIAAPDSVELGALAGRADARNAGTGEWLWRGFGGGAVLGPVGGGFAYALARNSDVTLPPHRALILASETGPAYAQSYEAAFSETLRDRRKKSALTGGILGTAALATVATAVWAIYYYY